MSAKVGPVLAAQNKSRDGAERAQIYGEKKAQEFILLSNVAGASLCAVIMPYIGNGFGSRRTAREYWQRLAEIGLFAKQLWTLYVDDVLK